GVGLGIGCVSLDPTPGAPASRVCRQIEAAYDDRTALAELASVTEVCTFEFENVPADAAAFLGERVPVFPPPKALEIAQDRLLEKVLFETIGLPAAPFAPAASHEELAEALEVIGVPSVLKTRRLGYDGKGQVRLASVDDAAEAWRAVGEAPSLLESFVGFDRELSILGVRGRDGSTAFYPLVENHHRDGILRVSIAPARGVTDELQRAAERHATAVMDLLGYVGVLAIELFQVGERLLGNEIAPRVHNSGHWTIEGATTSQFENHLRAICGMELGPTTHSAYSAMVNLIGRVPPDGSIPEGPGVHVHAYGKHERPGRKVGHVTVVGDDADTVFRVLQLVTRTADT
ncbi:MAG TPA: 5-(carboxyamino)imidazole ribonucleotide synthase, partial [Actinomycetota bacterium]